MYPWVTSNSKSRVPEFAVDGVIFNGQKEQQQKSFYSHFSTFCLEGLLGLHSCGGQAWDMAKAETRGPGSVLTSLDIPSLYVIIERTDVVHAYSRVIPVHQLSTHET